MIDGNFYIKNKGGNFAEAWIENWEEVICEAKLITKGNEECLVDTLFTKPKYRKKGYAKELLENLESIFAKVTPIGIEPQAEEFWKKLGYEDGLGEEIDE